MISGIIVAAGRGRRMGAGENKIFLKVDQKTVIEYTVDAFDVCDDIDEIIVVTGKEDIERCRTILKNISKPLKIISGGETRQKSVQKGVVASKGDILAVHDGARPLVTPELISATVEACKIYGAAAPGVLSKDTIKIADDSGFIEKTIERSRAYNIQTPQIFRRDILIKAHELGKNVEATDDCMLAEVAGVRIKIVEGSYTNIKVTTPEDMETVSGLMKKRKDWEKAECAISE